MTLIGRSYGHSHIVRARQSMHAIFPSSSDQSPTAIDAPNTDGARPNMHLVYSPAYASISQAFGRVGDGIVLPCNKLYRIETLVPGGIIKLGRLAALFRCTLSQIFFRQSLYNVVQDVCSRWADLCCTPCEQCPSRTFLRPALSFSKTC